jgi:Kef-type K+ transport system membrane component KefB
MPQFDTFSFLTQLVWVLIFFTLLYFTLIYFVIPAISTILKVRKRKLQNNENIASNSLTVATSSLSLILNQISQENIYLDSTSLNISQTISSISTVYTQYTIYLENTVQAAILKFESYARSC